MFAIQQQHAIQQRREFAVFIPDFTILGNCKIKDKQNISPDKQRKIGISLSYFLLITDSITCQYCRILNKQIYWISLGIYSAFPIFPNVPVWWYPGSKYHMGDSENGIIVDFFSGLRNMPVLRDDGMQKIPYPAISRENTRIYYHRSAHACLSMRTPAFQMKGMLRGAKEVGLQHKIDWQLNRNYV